MTAETLANRIIANQTMSRDQAYLLSVTPDTFTEEGYLRAVAEEYFPDATPAQQIDKLQWVLNDSDGRRYATKSRLGLFCILYLRDDFVLRVGPNAGQFTVNDLTLHAWRTCYEWIRPRIEPKEMRWIWASPRESGKSTMVFKAIPLWLAAHKHATFIAAFAHTYEQAKARLSDFRNVLHFNTLLKSDYPGLCAAAKRGSFVESDTAQKFKAASQFAFYVSGAGGSYLGLLDDGMRPDVILLDDLEAGGENFSQTLSNSRLRTIRETILGLSQYARVLWSGTTVGYNSLVHQAIKSSKGDIVETEDVDDWCRAEAFKVTHFTAINEGRSIWPAKWSVEYLKTEQERSPRTYALNFDNSPLSAAGGWWKPSQIIIGSAPGPLSHVVLMIDPAVSDAPGRSKATDPTGIAVVGWDRETDIIEIMHVEGKQLSPETLHARIIALTDRFPELTYISIEGNRSDGPWARKVFSDVRLKWLPDVHQRVSKDVRIMHLHQEYEDGKVVHRYRFPSYEEQCLSWAGEKSIPHDDEIDAVAMAVSRIRFKAPTTLMHF